MAECLRDVCRLCGGGGAAGIDRRHPHSKEKYHQVMLRALDVDVHTDEMGTHPPFVCHNCVKKLMKWWSAAKLKKKLQLNIEVCEFVLHRCERCVQPLGLSSLCDELNAVLVSHPSFFIWRGTNLMKIIHYGDSGRPEVEISINSTLTWLIEVCGVDVAGSGCPVLQDIPVTAGVPDVSRVLETLEAHNICSANRDFNKLVKSREGPAGQIPTSVTGRDIVQVYPYPTIRHNKCHLLVSKPGLLCEVCVMFRVDLNVMASRLGGSREVTTSSSIRNNTMSNAELQKKMKLMKMENKALKKRNAVLHTKITAMIQVESVEVNTQEGSFLHQAMQDGEKEFMMASIEGSPAGLLWEQQKASFQKGKGMRWHPAIIRFCIALQSKSSSSYNLLRESGFLKLPHPNTLHPYTHFGDPAPGFNADLVLRVISDMKLHTLPQHQREVCVLFDEMKIKASLVYSVRSGAVVGFVDVGSIGNEILQFEKRCQDEDISIASHVLVLMVRGIFTSLRTPIGYYPSLGVSSHQLYPCMWEAIMLLEAAGFSVRGLVSDGASPNRKFYRMHGPREEFLHSTPHPATNNQLYFFCDPPHLIKTTRNNWENSGCHNKTRNLHVSICMLT
ncbi:uncharacterized protein LOC119725265 [Patiria miniata]|uniref:Transposable element P transposase-like RNase H domain-containing protein n=1 Tax=Patiria miniata TaxID=46514 RepID=A0A913ZMF7_PATMI|nr:uncharacterized protein LOC119725265 [Patiria miniata]